jgi:hypothetical protein
VSVVGRNAMLERGIGEAQALLENNFSTATKNLDSLKEDFDFLQSQFTYHFFFFGGNSV